MGATTTTTDPSEFRLRRYTSRDRDRVIYKPLQNLELPGNESDSTVGNKTAEALETTKRSMRIKGRGDVVVLSAFGANPKAIVHDAVNS